uniref:helix-turn-helix domain-containing protein n=1 Tax=Agathobacter sp. TaxID=2021311 RepID=UPI0040568F5F
MSIYNSGEVIRHARTTANLTLHQLAEGICKVSTLSQIENGTLNASSSVFDALMSRMGVSYTTFPYFKNRTDFECFYALKRAHFYLDSWQLAQACQELDFAEQQLWAENRLHYMEWVLLHGKLQLVSGCCNHEKNFRFLLYGLHQTHPHLNLLDFHSHLLSKSELEFLILLAEESLYLNRLDDCISICTQIDTYLNQTHISYLEKKRLSADNTIVMGKYYIVTHQYEAALSIIEPCRLQMEVPNHDMPLLRLTFLNGLACYFHKETENALVLLKTALYSAHAIGSCYTANCIQYLEKYTDLDLHTLFPLKAIPLTRFADKSPILPPNLSDSTYDMLSPDALTLGQILRHLREEQELPLEIISRGLCSKSALSKIENNQMQPDILLMEALLQRLGVSERIFTFYGSPLESQFYDLKSKSIDAQQTYLSSLPHYIRQLEKISSPKNIFQKQFILFISAILRNSPQDRISAYLEALHCTLPDFDISHIHNYRLSWAELNCITNIAYTYIQTETPIKGFHYFSQLMSYSQTSASDCILHSNTHLRTFEMFCRALYKQKHYKDILYTFLPKHLSAFQTNTKRCSFFLFYYSLSLGECKNYEQARLYGNYACALSHLNNLTPNAIALHQHFINDFSMTLDIFY